MNLEKLIYKQDMKNNTMRISKTKVISIIVFIIFFIWPLYDFLFDLKYSYMGLGSAVLAAIFIGLIVSVPTFIIGFIISKITGKTNKSSQTIDTSPTNINSQNKLEGIDKNIQSNVKVIKTNSNNVNSNPKLLKINELKNEFDEKELTTKELIKTKFEPPQITYNRFIAVVDNCSKIFNEQYTSALNLINLSNNSSEKVDAEINSKINILQSLIEKLNDLSNELVINISKTKDDDIDHVLNDMENLISSINNYKD